jgi:hypothetical protein
LATLGTAQAEPQAVVKKVNDNHNSYTYYNYKKASAKATSAPAAHYSEVTVAAPPRLEAVPQAPAEGPVYASPPHLTPPPLTPAPVQSDVTTYTQNFNSGPSLPANRSGSFSSSIYSMGPNWGPGYYGPYSPGGYYPYNNGLYTGGYYNNGLTNGVGLQGFYTNGNGLTVRAGIPGPGFYPGTGYCPPGGYNRGYRPSVCGPGFVPNLTPQRFDPQPGDHPYSIQMPRPRR